jgi:polyhydroxyalkanoate synthesis regulator phasin
MGLVAKKNRRYWKFLELAKHTLSGKAEEGQIMCRELSTKAEIEYIAIPTVNNNAKTDTAAELAELRDRIEALEEQIAKIDIPQKLKTFCEA